MARQTRQITQPKNVAVFSEIIEEPNLPARFVHYPNHYGVFFAFGQTTDEVPKLCLCAKGAVEVTLKYLSAGNRRNYTDPLITAPLSSHFFPKSLAQYSLEHHSDHLEFAEKLCHRCNLLPPSQSFCHPMYGGLFKQTYGWYIQQTQLRYGVVSNTEVVVPEQCPPDIRNLIKCHRESIGRRNSMVASWEKDHDRSQPMPRSDEIEQIDKCSKKLHRQIENFFENETRQEFGFKKIGDAWVGETILAQLVTKIFPNQQVIRHHRPEWLDGLELDVFVPSQNLGFEYQGQQHYFAIKAWGGQKALESNQARDAKKRKLCKIADVGLIEIRFSEPLILEYVLDRIQSLRNT